MPKGSKPIADHKTLYIVQGSSGEYSDHLEWQIAAYADEAEARKHAEAAGAYARETYQMWIDPKNDDSVGFDRENEILRTRNAKNPYDRYFTSETWFDHDVKYTVLPVPLRESAPTLSDPMLGKEPQR